MLAEVYFLRWLRRITPRKQADSNSAGKRIKSSFVRIYKMGLIVDASIAVIKLIEFTLEQRRF
jgi:hypothetical protein